MDWGIILKTSKNCTKRLGKIRNKKRIKVKKQHITIGIEWWNWKKNQNFTKSLIVRNQKNINHIQRGGKWGAALKI